MVGWHHRLNGHEFEQVPGDSEGQGSLVCCRPWGHRELDMTKQPNNNSGLPSCFLPLLIVFLFLSSDLTPNCSHLLSVSRDSYFGTIFCLQFLCLFIFVVQLLGRVPMDCSLSSSSVHRVSQARILEWAAISFSRGSSQPRDQTCVFCLGRQFLYHRVI